jgi:SAM-dependent methyltransferase
MELLAGCGSSRDMKLALPDCDGWTNLVTLDMNPDHKPDVVHDLTQLPYPFPDNHFDQMHFYDVLEHLGQQGDYKTFFAQFSEFWRILKPGGHLLAVSPGPSSPWAWGDPGHTRIMTQECLTFLHQPAYAQIGRTPMSDYRFCYQADFDINHSVIDGNAHIFILEAIKPSRMKAAGGANAEAA